jgi:hypothetical protein
MRPNAFKHATLMEESEARVAAAIIDGTPDERIVASRVLETAHSYQHWETEHDRLMRAVAGQSRLAQQCEVLRATAFSLLHRKALFEYLRERRVTGPKRHKLLAVFYGPREYAGAMVKEHTNYVRSGSSYLCAFHLGSQLIGDPAFDEPLELYQQWYSEYFRLFCDSALCETAQERAALGSMEALKPLLKSQLTQARQAILTMSHVAGLRWRDAEIRKPTGDTQKIRALFSELSIVEDRPGKPRR